MKTTSKVLLALLAAVAARSFAAKADCDAYKKSQKQVTDLMAEQEKLSSEGKTKAAKCGGDQGCLKGLDPLRNQVKALGQKMADARESMQKSGSLCDEVKEEDEKTIKLFEKVGADNCKPGGNATRCEDALFQMADLGYRADTRANMGAREKYEREYEKWKENDKRGPEPKAAKASFEKSYSTHKRYLKDNPKGNRRDLVLYRLAFIYDMQGGSEDAFPLWMEIIRNTPTSRHVPAVNLRVGEFYFTSKKYDSAIAYYNKIDAASKDLQAVDNNLLGLAIYHKAEALYNLAKYDKALDGLFDYIERVDNGQIKRGDLRTEAILYMGSCFAEFPESYKDAEKFFKKHGGRRYEDTLFYEMAKKHDDRDQFELAINTYEYFLKRWPYYYKAPMAQIGLIRVWVKQKKIEEAQEARDILIAQYSPNAPWWSKAPKMERKDQELLQDEIRNAMLESAVSDHFPGKERNDSNRVKKGIKSYERFIAAYQAEGGWPIYRAKIYMADALSFVRRYEEAADCYTWASQQDVSKYGEAKKGERNLTQPADAGYNAVVELSRAADLEVDRVGKEKAKEVYQKSVCVKYVKTTDSYITRFPKAKEVDNLAYNLFLFMVNAEDFSNAIAQGSRFLTLWPTHQFHNDGRARLAYCYTQAGKLDLAEAEYVKVIAALKPNDTLRTAMVGNISEVIWKMGVAAEKAGKVDSAVYHFRRLAKTYPQLTVADTAALEAGAVYLRNKRYMDAGNEFMTFVNAHMKSPLSLKAMWSAGENFVLAKDTAKGIATYLDYYNKFPADSNAFNGVLVAASLYDSSKKEMDKAKTFELLQQRFPKDERTPGYLYTAGLTYEKSKKFEDAIRIYKQVVALYPKHSYAPEAAFSIPIIEEKQNNKKAMAEGYEKFATEYKADKSKVSKAYLRAATYYYKDEKNSKKAEELYRKLVDFYKEGDNKVSIDASIPSEAYFTIGEIRTAEANNVKLGGEIELAPKKMNDLIKLVDKKVEGVVASVKARSEALKPANEAFAETIKLQIEEWALKATMAMADNDYKVATDFASYKPSKATNSLETQAGIVFRVKIGKEVPTLTGKAAKAYGSLLDLAYASGIQNDRTKEASKKLLSCYIMQGQALESIGDAFASESCPSQAKEGSDQWNEECEFHKAQKEDKQMQFQKAAGKSGYAPGIEAASKYGIIGPQLDSLIAKVKFFDAENPILAVQIVEKKVEPKVFVDKDYVRSMKRIEDVAKSDLPDEERIQTLKGFAVEGTRAEQDLMAEIEALKAKLKGK
jgi:tetratricopeptide (TPR) repeat protein